MTTKIKTVSEIDVMRVGGRMLASVLNTVRKEAHPGVSTKYLADIAAKELKAIGAESSFLGHHGFPDVICISVNDEVVHGIPSVKRVLTEGDVVGLDFGVRYRGMVTDSAVTVIVGDARSSKHQELLNVTERALQAGIDAVHAKVRTGDIGAAVEAVVRPYRYGIVKDLVGHGVGHEVWEDPNVPNYGRPNTGPWLEAGMTIAIEPMLTLGTDRVVIDDDGWTIRTADGSVSAHFEHTVLILEDGAEILTSI